MQDKNSGSHLANITAAEAICNIATSGDKSTNTRFYVKIFLYGYDTRLWWKDEYNRLT